MAFKKEDAYEREELLGRVKCVSGGSHQSRPDAYPELGTAHKLVDRKHIFIRRLRLYIVDERV